MKPDRLTTMLHVITEILGDDALAALSKDALKRVELRRTMGENALFTEDQVATILNCSTRTVQRLVDDERLNPLIVAGRRQYPQGQIIRYIRTCSTKYQ